MIALDSHAKINLFLEILGKRPDGFHELVTVMQQISLADSLTAERTEQGVSVKTDDPTLPRDTDNLAGRAAALVLDELGAPGGVRISIVKRIPIGAGLGGGSSNAAAAMRAVNELYGGALSLDRLAALAAGIGSDVPFFLYGGAALCTGRGEIIEQTAAGPAWRATLYCPELFVSTAKVYGNLTYDHRPRDGQAFWQAYCAGDFEGLIFNRLEAAACELHPDLCRLRDAGLLMSGSGSTFFAFSPVELSGITTHSVQSIQP